MAAKRKRMLITGVSGLLGNNLAYYFRHTYDILGVYHEHPVTIPGVKTRRLDILSQTAVRQAVRVFKPAILLHCASLTNVDFCETHKAFTRDTNVTATGYIVDAAAHEGAKLAYISTDSVYDGINGNFSERSPVAPQNYYGQSKYEGEQKVLRLSGSLILRTNIFGWNIQKNKFSIAEWILRELSLCRPVQGFKDARFSSIYTLELARVLEKALRKELSGVYNCASRTSLSKYEFARLLARRFKMDESLVQPISIDDFGFVARRGKNLTLDVARLAGDLAAGLPSIEQCVERFYRDYASGEAAKIKQEKFVLSSHCPAARRIPYGRQTIDARDIGAVDTVMRSDFITQGPKINAFEEALCAYTGAKHCVCVANGTAALHLACLAAGVRTGSRVITSAMTFAASANCALYCGAQPVFADIQERTANIDPKEIARCLSRQVKAIIPVHFAGHPCDLDQIHRLARKHGLVVIEDAAHALGARYNGTTIGSCAFSDMAVLSFHPVKSITTGEGGAVLTNDKALYEKLLMLRNHGITKKGFVNPPDGDWYYEMQALGFNYRMTDMQAALGISQLKKLERFIARRREIAAMYGRAFAGNHYFDLPQEQKGISSSWHLYPIRLKDRLVPRKREIFAQLRHAGVGVQVHYIPVYLHPYYRSLGFKQGTCPNAEDFYLREISIPMYPSIKKAEIDYVIRTMYRVCKDACR